MTIYNLGSINRDLIYQMQRLPQAGETIAAQEFIEMLGGKGLNQSVAATRAGADLVHIGAIGKDDRDMRERLQNLGLDTSAIAGVDHPTGHAIVSVDEAGENAIVLLQGANVQQDQDMIKQSLKNIKDSDFLMLQNETNYQLLAAQIAYDVGATVVYSAAPFSATAVEAVLPFVDILVVNTVERQQLSDALGIGEFDLPVSTAIITKGAEGADWIDIKSKVSKATPAMNAEVVDTTGAGDTFIGYVVSGLAEGLPPDEAMRLGSVAAAIMVSRKGTASAIPTRAEVDARL
ncbi:ribokinase [Algirhabdus cladophorae]|uniref:ribokinase n=1 Tax=Algirhabdus cladophorae TaxID=3377108 RepID=UPI003B84ABED